ncbi:GNAT family N-acetyltransferase [Phreatobacter stygius]|uniref:GNAT family N-acetyltransferase n=1 Tax=Phreatobacter stygius TaxID=1940610 RepID=A0A4D7B7K6_9HYPH|nr:GNAT family N-acetyltransferase [Phreatobacter stygius]QCI63877.1 GNAT family N-acetyltransferase [Phreatobacter stygius]
MPAPIDFAVRPYRASDLDAVIAIFLGAIRQVASKDYDPAQIDAWAQVDRAAWGQRRLSRTTFVAVVGQVVVGFADLEPDGHLDMMFVHPAYQRMGIASLLLATVEATAGTRRIPWIRAEVSITARPFFESRGFQLVATQEVALRGQLLTNHRMQKAIAQHMTAPT